MAAFSSIALGIGAIAAVVGTGAQLYSGMQAAKEQKKAREAQQRQQNLQYRRSQISNLRQAQIASARSFVQAGAVGGLGGSGFAGGRSSFSAGFGADSGYASQISGLSNQISIAQQRAADWQGIGNIGGAVAGFGKQLFSYASSLPQSTATVPPGGIGGYTPAFGYGNLSYGFAGK